MQIELNFNYGTYSRVKAYGSKLLVQFHKHAFVNLKLTKVKRIQPSLINTELILHSLGL